MGRPVNRYGTRLTLDAQPASLTAAGAGANSGLMSLGCKNRSRVPLTLSVCNLLSRDQQVALSALSVTPAVNINLPACSPSGKPLSMNVTVGNWSPRAPGYCTIDAEVRVVTAYSTGLLGVVMPDEDVTVT